MSCESNLEYFNHFKRSCERADEILRQRLGHVNIKIENLAFQNEDWRNDKHGNNSLSTYNSYSYVSNKNSNDQRYSKDTNQHHSSEDKKPILREISINKESIERNINEENLSKVYTYII